MLLMYDTIFAEEQHLYCGAMTIKLQGLNTLPWIETKSVLPLWLLPINKKYWNKENPRKDSKMNNLKETLTNVCKYFCINFRLFLLHLTLIRS